MKQNRPSKFVVLLYLCLVKVDDELRGNLALLQTHLEFLGEVVGVEIAAGLEVRVLLVASQQVQVLVDCRDELGAEEPHFFRLLGDVRLVGQQLVKGYEVVFTQVRIHEVMD